MPASAAAITTLEKRIGATLPKEYQNFLRQVNGVLFESPLKLVVPSLDIAYCFSLLFGINADEIGTGSYDIVFEMFLGEVERRLPAAMIAIGQLTGGGDLLVMSCGGEDVGSVYLWRSNGVPVHTETVSRSCHSLYLVAGSFVEFYSSWTLFPLDEY